MAREPSASADEIRSTALRLLARREHSARELERKLAARGHSVEAAAEVVSSLSEAALLSETRFAEAFVRSRVERGQGPLKIRAELRERGLADEAIDAVLTQTAEFWVAGARRVLAKRFRDTADEASQSRAEWNRRARFLSQRGFPSDLIYRALGSDAD